MTETQKKLPMVRLSVTGVFMGLANLVPGVSGGTMVLALGLYEEFIEAMANLSRLPGRLISDGPVGAARWFGRSAIVLAMLFGISFITIAVLAGVIQYLMAMFQPGMLALFIGMTLGGAPMLWREMQPLRAPSIAGFVVGFVVMALVALVFRPGGGDPSWILYFVGGIIASSAMILPGISGSYMLLILGLYIPIISGISDGVHALKAGDLPTCFDLGLRIGLPVGLGLLIGLVAFSNLIKHCLDKFHAPTIGFLMGLLVGSVLGLYPFQMTSFDKLPRHAQNGTLTVAAYGWQPAAGDPVFQELNKLHDRGVAMTYIAGPDRAPELPEIEVARAAGAVVVVYDQMIARDVRKEASTRRDGNKVEVVFVPNAERNATKTVMVLLLAAAGFGLTLLLGRMGGKEEAPPAAG